MLFIYYIFRRLHCRCLCLLLMPINPPGYLVDGNKLIAFTWQQCNTSCAKMRTPFLSTANIAHLCSLRILSRSFLLLLYLKLYVSLIGIRLLQRTPEQTRGHRQGHSSVWLCWGDCQVSYSRTTCDGQTDDHIRQIHTNNSDFWLWCC